MPLNYPRMLYPGGDATARPVLADNEQEEAEYRSQGYLRLGDSQAAAAPPSASEPAKRVGRPPGRPPKVKP